MRIVLWTCMWEGIVTRDGKVVPMLLALAGRRRRQRPRLRRAGRGRPATVKLPLHLPPLNSACCWKQHQVPPLHTLSTMRTLQYLPQTWYSDRVFIIFPITPTTNSHILSTCWLGEAGVAAQGRLSERGRVLSVWRRMQLRGSSAR